MYVHVLLLTVVFCLLVFLYGLASDVSLFATLEHTVMMITITILTEASMKLWRPHDDCFGQTAVTGTIKENILTHSFLEILPKNAF